MLSNYLKTALRSLLHPDHAMGNKWMELWQIQPACWLY